MATIKSYTDLKQSKKLAKILPLEGADMHYSKDFDGSWFVDLAEYTSVKIPKYVGNIEEHLLPCWSLAALLGVLPDEIIDDGDVYRNMFFHLKGRYIIQYSRLTTLWPSLLSVESDNPTDACYEMIIHLHEFKML